MYILQLLVGAAIGSIAFAISALPNNDLQNTTESHIRSLLPRADKERPSKSGGKPMIDIINRIRKAKGLPNATWSNLLADNAAKNAGSAKRLQTLQKRQIIRGIL
jgi:uncharacterized protein YkwD